MNPCKLKISKALHELGYDGECNHYHVITDVGDEIMSYEEFVDFFGWQSAIYGAPRLDDVAYWIRDKHGIVINVSYADFYDPDEWFFILLNKSDCSTLYNKLECFPTYEDALETGVIKALEIIKKKQHENNKI